MQKIEIIRCTECAHHIDLRDAGIEPAIPGTNIWCNRLGYIIPSCPNGFCSWAVREPGKWKKEGNR